MKVIFSHSSEKELLKLNRPLAQKILLKTAELGNDPFGQGAKKLEGGKGYRIRVGDYRVVYTIDHFSKTITIIRVKHRKDVYR